MIFRFDVIDKTSGGGGGTLRYSYFRCRLDNQKLKMLLVINMDMYLCFLLHPANGLGEVDLVRVVHAVFLKFIKQCVLLQRIAFAGFILYVCSPGNILGQREYLAFSW